MDQESQDGAKKISTPEIILVGSFFALIDIIDLVGLIFALPLSDFTSIIAFPASQVYAYFRGIRQDMLLISNGLELIPYIGSMPLRTIAFGITVYTENNPKLKAALGVAEKVTGKKEEAPTAGLEATPAKEFGIAEKRKEEAEKVTEEKGQLEIEAERLGGAYEYKAQPGLEETLAEGSEQQLGKEKAGDKVVESSGRFSGKEEKGEKKEEEEQEIEAERMGGAYAQTGEAQQAKTMEEAGLAEGVGMGSNKTKEVEVDENTGTVNLKPTNDNIIDGRSHFGRKPSEGERQKKAA